MAELIVLEQCHFHGTMEIQQEWSLRLPKVQKRPPESLEQLYQFGKKL